MMPKRMYTAVFLGLCGLIAAWTSSPCRADLLEEARKAFEGGDARTTIDLLIKEIAENPGHEEAYILLAQAYEKQDNKEKAAEIWTQLKAISRVDSRVQEARAGLLRTRGPLTPPQNPDEKWKDDPYLVDIGEINWDELKAVDDAKYNDKLPAYWHESRHFVIFAVTERMAEVGAELCEKYLAFLMKEYLDGQAWALRLPIFIYKNHQDYVSIGGYPDFSAGGTMSDPLFGRPDRIAMYMLDEKGMLDRDALEGTLPHELTHMVTHEFFGAQELPQWLDEGMSRRMEQTRKHYEEAARTGRDAVAGEYFRFRDLFEQEGYPEGSFRMWRFYEQSATIVLYMLEQGPESVVTFLSALKEGRTHDEAIAAALGIPKEGAVEELEKRWVEWIKNCYVHQRAKLEDGQAFSAGPVKDGVINIPIPPKKDEPGASPTPTPTPTPTPNPDGTAPKAETSTIYQAVVSASFSELATAAKISNWTSVGTDSTNKFKGLGASLQEWKSEGGKMVYKGPEGATGSLLGIRLDEEPPMVLRCKVRAVEASRSRPAVFGLAMLDHRGDDTGIQAKVQLTDSRPHQVTCLVTHEIVVYLDDACMGRAPALSFEELDEDIDHPVAFVGYSPVEVSEVEAAMIKEFVIEEKKAEPGKEGEANPGGPRG